MRKRQKQILDVQQNWVDCEARTLSEQSHAISLAKYLDGLFECVRGIGISAPVAETLINRVLIKTISDLRKHKCAEVDLSKELDSQAKRITFAR